MYTDNSVDEGGNTQVYASVYSPKSENLRFMPIETEKEWRIIAFILEKLKAEIKGEVT